MITALELLLIAFLSYLIGSIPTAVIISKKFFGFDIREKGSGNMGSTNAFRLLGWKWGLTVQLIDILKGAAAVVLVAGILGKGLHFPNTTPFEDLTLIKIGAGFFAVIGHIFSVFAGFRGGKGMNTILGMIIGIAPVDALIAVSVFIIVVSLSGYISLGSIISAFILPSSMFFRHNFLNVYVPGYYTLIYFLFAISALVIYTHRGNIHRLVKGTENRFSKLQLIKWKKK